MSYATNKAFKWDSCRVAFLLCVGFCISQNTEISYCLVHTLGNSC
ncbi:DUF3265 domain-containing protein [Vibrio vulnificus]|nr:DUF3265 domain-containing protein [Vibrio vulnificus]